MASVAMRRKSPFYTYTVIDEDFDADDGFEAAALDSIQRCGTIDIHPNGWGIHDSLGVNSDNIPRSGEMDPEAVQKMAADRSRRYNESLWQEKQLRAEAKAMELDRFEALKAKIAAFPHSTDQIAWETATEFTQFGTDDALRRGITGDEWIWKRSRFLAGFK